MLLIEPLIFFHLFLDHGCDIKERILSIIFRYVACVFIRLHEDASQEIR